MLRLFFYNLGFSFHFLKLPLTPGRALEESATWAAACRLTSLASSKGILGWRASWWICIDLISGAVVLQWGHSNFACPPLSCPVLSACPAFPPPLFVVAASIFDAISFAVCFFGFAFPVISFFGWRETLGRWKTLSSFEILIDGTRVTGIYIYIGRFYLSFYLLAVWMVKWYSMFWFDEFDTWCVVTGPNFLWCERLGQLMSTSASLAWAILHPIYFIITIFRYLFNTKK